MSSNVVNPARSTLVIASHTAEEIPPLSSEDHKLMRVLVDGLDTVIEGEVIGGELLDGVSGQYDLESAFTVKCDDGVCFLVHGWLVDVEILNPLAPRVM